MTIATLQPIAERAAAASVNGRLLLIDVSAKGITTAGKLFLPGAAGTLAQALDAPARTFSAMQLTTWAVIAVRGADAVAAALAAVIAELDRLADKHGG